jgi:hypothetical protein
MATKKERMIAKRMCDSPARDKQSNRLPAQADSFNVIVRLYWPKKEVVDGAWKLPPKSRSSVTLEELRGGHHERSRGAPSTSLATLE